MTNHTIPDKFLQQLSALKRALRLTTQETQDMRERLSVYTDMHAVNASTNRNALRSPYLSFFYSRAFVAGALILILVLGTGTTITYAAGNSLPGQTLYPLKVDVAEPIQGAVIAATSGAEGSAEWQNTLAERRITEATTLAAQNDLASSTEVYLQGQAEIHVAQSEDDAAKFAAAGNTSEANDIRTDLAARLGAHAELLALIAPRLAAAGDASTTSQVATLLDNVSQEQASVWFGRDESGEAVSASSTVSSSSPGEASTTVTIALSSNGNSSPSFHSEEAKFFEAHVGILNLLPPASTTASTSPSKNRKHRHAWGGLDSANSAPSTTTPMTVTSTTTTDFPASGNSESTTSIQVDF